MGKINLINEEFEELLAQENNRQELEVFPFEYEGNKYWVKKARKTSSNIFHKLAYKLFSYDVLIPVESKSLEESIDYESKKLISFVENSINAPKVVFKNSDFFVMTDTGAAIYTFLRKNDVTSDEFYFYLDGMIDTLCEIHSKDFYHGGAQSRNFTYKDKLVYAIDLEDSFDESKVDLKTLQFRDLFLLLLSMTKVDNFEFSYRYIINKYIEQTGNKEFRNKLKKISENLYFLVKLNKLSFFHKVFPRDVKGFCKLLEELKNYN